MTTAPPSETADTTTTAGNLDTVSTVPKVRIGTSPRTISINRGGGTSEHRDTLASTAWPDTSRRNVPISATLPAPSAGHKAELGYNYQPRMARGSTQIITAMVKIKHHAGEHPVRPALENIITNENAGVERKDDSTYVYPQEMRVYQYLTIKLSDPTGECKIEPEDSARQELDTLDGNLWRWSVTTNTIRPDVLLRLQVFGERRNGGSGYLPAVSLPIRITVKPTYARAVETHLLDNPAVLWGAIIGIAGFAAWLIKYLLQKKKGSGGDNDKADT